MVESFYFYSYNNNLFSHSYMISSSWRSREEFISNVLLRTPWHGWAKAGRPARIYIQQLCEDTGCRPEDQPEVMNDREEWWERLRDIRAGGTTRWWFQFNTNDFDSYKVSIAPISYKQVLQLYAFKLLFLFNNNNNDNNLFAFSDMVSSILLY